MFFFLFVCFLCRPQHTHSYATAAKKQRCSRTYGYCEINIGPDPEQSGLFLFFFSFSSFSPFYCIRRWMYVHMLGVVLCFFCRLRVWIESTSADFVLTGSVVSISQRQLWSEWNETTVYLSQGPIMCVSLSARRCFVCFCVQFLQYVEYCMWNVDGPTGRLCERVICVLHVLCI